MHSIGSGGGTVFVVDISGVVVAFMGTSVGTSAAD